MKSHVASLEKVATMFYDYNMWRLTLFTCFNDIKFVEICPWNGLFGNHFRQPKLSLVVDTSGFHMLKFLTSSCLRYSSNIFLMWQDSNIWSCLKDLSLNYFIITKSSSNRQPQAFEISGVQKLHSHLSAKKLLHSNWVPVPRLTELLSHADSWMGLIPGYCLFITWIKFSSYFLFQKF